MRLRILAALLGLCAGQGSAVTWTAEEQAIIRSLSLSQLAALTPQDFPSNRYAFDDRARALGAALFRDRGLSRRGDVACATCHVREQGYASAKVVKSERGWRRVPTLYGVGFLDFFFWDGRKDSLWAQALGPLTNPKEHDLTPGQIVSLVTERHRAAYERTFGPVPPAALGGGEAQLRVLANVGKALAAYELTILPPRTTFDAYADALGMNDRTAVDRTGFGICAQQGLKTFIGSGRCRSCHFGPLLTNHYFHNTGVPLVAVSDRSHGFSFSRAELETDPLRCQGPFADRRPDGTDPCPHVTHAVFASMLLGAYKTPTLRGVSQRAPYMHNGVFPTLAAVIDHYAAAPTGLLGDSEVLPVALTPAERTGLRCFLWSL